jgi:thiamine-monophosphate kinase
VTGRSSELERIARIAARFAVPAGSAIARGIGDDAAVLDGGLRGAAQIVWTVDAQVEGVHFRTDLASWEDVGWRSFMAAASDLAAMGATPWCALGSLVLSPVIDDAALDALTLGQSDAARAVGAPIVGGNLSRGGEVSVTTTLLGTCARAVERTAQAGDGVWLAGDVGLAAAGLAALERKLDPTRDADVALAVAAWRRPRARIADGLAMARLARGAIDVSDGLARDLGHIAHAARVRAVLEEPALRDLVAPNLVRLAALLGKDPLDFALGGGEDYALVAASASKIPGFVRIGRFEAGEGVALEDRSGRAHPLHAHGFDHFAPSP